MEGVCTLTPFVEMSFVDNNPEHVACQEEFPHPGPGASKGRHQSTFSIFHGLDF
jgi:hypothetical protein